MAKSYNHLEKFSTGKKEEMRDQLLSELQSEASEGLPEEASGYKLPPLVEGITEEMVEPIVTVVAPVPVIVTN